MKESSNTTNSLAHMRWNCKYHIVFAPKYRRKVFYEEHRLEVREILRKLCEREERKSDTRKYVANQLKTDKEADQLSMFDPRDPLTGSK